MRWVIWWFAILSAYVIEFVTQVVSEVVAGIIIAFLCTIVVAAALRNASPDVRVYWRWLRHLSKIPAAMLRDALQVSGRIIWALRTGNQLVGMLVRIPYDPGDRKNPLDIGREALVVYGTCAAPNTMVADVDLRGNLLVHQLIAREQPFESEQWPL
jgi:multisubunit Na+/H+ antiporter MnhE subunit